MILIMSQEPSGARIMQWNDVKLEDGKILIFTI
jgi:hypothetical protein